MRRTGPRFLVASLLLACFPLVGWGQDDKAAKQKKAAEEIWKPVLNNDAPTIHETDNFLLIGTVDEKAMEKIGKALEKHLPFVMKSLRFEEDEDKHLLWEGKLIIHLCKDRTEFRTLYTKFKRERPLDDEISTYTHEGVISHILVGPPSAGKSPLPLEVEVVGQLGAATLTRKRTARLPAWFVNGYARSHAYRAFPKLFVRERQAAIALLAQGKKMGDVYADT